MSMFLNLFFYCAAAVDHWFGSALLLLMSFCIPAKGNIKASYYNRVH